MARFSLGRGSKQGDQGATAPGAQGAPQGGRPSPPGAQPTAPRPQPTAPGTRAPGAAPATGSSPAAPPPEPTVSERLEGQRGWLAQLDRRIGVRTYAGAAGLVIAIAAAAVALVLVLQLQDDAATGADIEQLREEIAGVEDTASEAAQEDVQSLTERITELESEIAGFSSDQDSTDQEISVVQDDIQDLRDQIADLDRDSGSAGASGSVENP